MRNVLNLHLNPNDHSEESGYDGTTRELIFSFEAPKKNVASLQGTEKKDDRCLELPTSAHIECSYLGYN